MKFHLQPSWRFLPLMTKKNNLNSNERINLQRKTFEKLQNNSRSKFRSKRCLQQLFTREKNAINIKTGASALLGQHKCIWLHIRCARTQDFINTYVVQACAQACLAWVQAQMRLIDALDCYSRGLHFFAFSTFKPQFSLNNLQNTKTPKLTKKLENNKTKNITNTS